MELQLYMKSLVQETRVIFICKMISLERVESFREMESEEETDGKRVEEKETGRRK